MLYPLHESCQWQDLQQDVLSFLTVPFHLSVHCDSIYRCNEKTDSEELVSNITISLNGLVEVAKEAGGPGYLTTIKRFPDKVEKFLMQYHLCNSVLVVGFFNTMHKILKT